jgi:predicted NAD-dependent protein-ADP-ribosyltransferase YbiA (DUF1768 family)
MSLRPAAPEPVVVSDRTRALLSYQGCVVNVDRGMTTGAPVPFPVRSQEAREAAKKTIIEPPVLSKEEFEMSKQVYDEFDDYKNVTDIYALNKARFVKYLETTVKPLFPKKFEKETGSALLEKFENNIADMGFWNKKGIFTYDEMITTFRGPTFWLSNMFPTMIYYNDVEEMFDSQNGAASQGAKIKSMKALMKKKIDAKKANAAVKLLHKTVEEQFFTDPEKRMFASPEHKFMASKVKVGSLLEAALVPPDPEKMALAMEGLALFETIRTKETAKEAKKLANNMEDKETKIRPLTKQQVANLLHSTEGKDKSPWAQMNQAIMARAIAKKFIYMPMLIELLQKLQDYQIFEGNYFFDELWGVKLDLIPWAPPSRLVKDQDGKLRGVLSNTEGDATVLEGQNWLGRCHMAVANAPNAASMTEYELFALLMSAMRNPAPPAPPAPPSRGQRILDRVKGGYSMFG